MKSSVDGSVGPPPTMNEVNQAVALQTAQTVGIVPIDQQNANLNFIPKVKIMYRPPHRFRRGS